MGYYTTFGQGDEIIVSPPLTYSEVKEWEAKHPPSEYASLKLKTLKEPVETDEGILTRTTGVAITPYEGSAKAYDFEDLVNEFVEMFAREGRTFTGRFDAHGEDPGDMWRLEIVNGEPVKTEAWIAWPEDLNALRKAWENTWPTSRSSEDSRRLSELRVAVAALLDVAHRKMTGDSH